jgi:hypothetical protein
MPKSINERTASLLCFIGERIWATVRDGKPFRYVHLDSSERGAIAPCLVFRLERGRRTPMVFGLEIKPGPGGVVISG